MMGWWKIAGFVLLALAVAGFLVAASGLIPIGASSGHWPVTRWFLRFSLERSTSTHSLGIDVPKLDDPALVLKGAGHYELGCRSCHGAPGETQPRIARAMLPTPPELVPRIRESGPKELFYVVKHGLKFTGMPAWPSQQRDDEVWAMVAFLLELPRLDARAYRELVYGRTVQPVPARLAHPAPPAGGEPAALAQSCVRCHGDAGQGRGGGAFPALAGQRRDYLANALHAYARGTRHSGIMEPVAAALSERGIAALADHYATMTPTRATSRAPADPAVLRRGREIAENGLPKRRVPACIECHGPKGTRTKPEYPLLSGLSADYLMLQLQLFKDGRRGGSAYAHLMEEVIGGIEPADMRAVTTYFASLPAADETPEPAAK